MEPKIHQAGIVDVTFGEGVVIISPVNLYRCRIGDSSFIGPFVEIQNDVSVGARCRIQSHSFLCSGVTIGDECFIGHGVMFVNDLMRNGRPDFEGTNWGRTEIGSSVIIGSNATILPVSICAGVVIGAGSVVTKNITRPGVYHGSPAEFVREIGST